jgi:hypothetical protein
MLGEIGREGRAGVIVFFRLEGTLEFLWKAPMESPPSVNELVGLLVNSEVETWYKVEEIRIEFQYDEGEGSGGEFPIDPWIAEYARNARTVIVSLVP